MKKLLVAFMLVLSAGSLMAQSKIGNVNTQLLLDTMPTRKDAMRKLIDFESGGKKELQEMKMDYDAAVQAYLQKQPTLSPVLQKIEEDKIMKKEQALYDRQQSLEAELQAYSQELNEPILNRVQEAIKIVSERKKLSYVIDQNVTLYFDKTLDITDEVVIELLRLDNAAMPN